MGNLLQQRALIAHRRNPIVAAAADIDGHPQAREPVVGIMVLARLNLPMRTDCRHYIQRTTSGLEQIERCRLDAAELDPFACPEGCLFFEPRAVSAAGWVQEKPKRER